MQTPTETEGPHHPWCCGSRAIPRSGTDRELKTTNTVLDTKLVAPWAV